MWKKFSLLTISLLVATLLFGCTPQDSSGLGDMFTNNVYPGATNTYSLGSSVYKFNDGYFHELHVDAATLYIGDQTLAEYIVANAPTSSSKFPSLETDPVFTASSAYSISSGDITNWNSKLSSFTELDPVFTASVAYGITSGNISTWNAALQSAGTSAGTYNNVTVGTSGLVTSGSIVAYVTGTPWTGMGYLTGNQSISLGGILSGSGTTSINASAASGYYMPSTGDQTAWNAKLSAVTGTNLDNIWSGTGILVRTGTATYSTITDSHSNWDAGYTYRLTSASGTAPLTLTLSSNGLTGSVDLSSKQATSTNLTSLAGLTYVSASFVKLTSANTFTLDTSTYETTTALSTWAGNTSITSVGTVGTGTWNGGVILGQYGGTGINNTGDTITLGGNINTANSFTTSGNFGLTLTQTGSTNITLPTSGTLFSTTTEVPNANIPNGINSGTSTADFSQSMGAGTYYYIPDSKLTMPTSTIAGMKTSTRMTWRLYMKKTAAGTAAFYVCIYRGVNGTIADTRDVAQSIGVATAALDNMVVDIQLTVTTTGASGAYHWSICAQNKAATATGFGVATGAGQFSGNVSSVAMNTASLIFGIGVMGTTGTTAITVPLVEAQAFNMD